MRLSKPRSTRRAVAAAKWTTKIALLLAVAAGCTTAAGAQTQKERVWVLPIEVDFDFGAPNGDAIINRFIPVYALIVRDEWKLINIALLSIADAPGGRPGAPGNPEPAPGPNVFGFGDITDGVVYTRTTKGGLMWGVGAAFGIPTATDDRLGSGKWSAGPGVRLGYQAGAWRMGLLAFNRWSFAGDEDRADINQLLIRALIRRPLGNRWFFVSTPIITANWNAPTGQRWLVPLGGGVGRAFTKKPTPVNLSLQAYANVVDPDGAPDWVARIGVTLPFALPARDR
jgi:hypothetical protein